MRTTRHVGVLAVALWAVCSRPAAAAGTNSTLLLSRPTGLGALPVPGSGGANLGPKAISGDGRMIVFSSGADDLGVQDTRQHIWVRDTLLETTTLVDRVPGGGAPGNGDDFTGDASISRDGGTVCFISSATNLVAGVAGGAHVFVVSLSTGAIVIADRRTGAAGAVGNNSFFLRCALDASGTRVVFDSFASNLVDGDTNGMPDVFLRDLGTNTTSRLSVTELGGEAPEGGQGGAISADGSKVAFHTLATLIASDDDEISDVYVRGTTAGPPIRASVRTGGMEADDDSFDAAIDDTGGHVAFASRATNLDLGPDTNGRTDVFWRDLTGSDTTIAVSRGSGGGALGEEASVRPAISGDGLGIAFESLAPNLGAGTPPGNTWVYLHRLGTNVTSLLSRASGVAGAPANGQARGVSLGTAPTVAVWESVGTNLTPDASGDFSGVFKRDLSGEPTTTLVSRPSGTGPRNEAVNHSIVLGARSVSADGRLVLIVSDADGLDPAAAGRPLQTFVRDVLDNTTTLVSRGPGPAGTAANDDTFAAAISADGMHVAFLSEATNLLDGITGLRQVYVRNLATGALVVASRADGPDGNLAVAADDLDISADGRRVAFTSREALVSADTNSRSDVYVRDLVAGTTTLASVSAGGSLADGDSSLPSLSRDGMRVAFESEASNLLDADPIVDSHVYVRDLAAGTTVLVDRHAVGGAPGTGDATRPMIDGAGNRIVFFAREPLTPEVIPPFGALYVRDLTTGTTALAGRGDGADGAAGSVTDASAISDDGQRVSFNGSGAELPGAPQILQIYVRDLAANTTTLASAADGTASTPANESTFRSSMSADGGCVVFDTTADNLTTPGYPTRDFSQVYLRAVFGECLGSPTTVTTTSTTLPPSTGSPIAVNSVVLRPGRLAKLVAKGLSTLPADPALADGTLEVRGTTGVANYALPASGWKPIGRREPKGFKFEGGGCRVTLLRRRFKAVCRGDTGSLRLPEPGPLAVVLTVGAERAAYCAECGGRSVGKPARVFKRKRCPAPAACP